MDKKSNPKIKNFSTIADVLVGFKGDRDKYISQEFQKYGYDLAIELGDPKNISFYIKLAKDNKRGFLEKARNFVKDANKVRSRPALFVWKLTQLKKEAKLKDEAKK
jgi:ubiquinone biosynthesis protein COQ9